MFDIGWSEIAVIAVVALIAIGPKELPGVLRIVGQWMGKARRMASEFQGQFQEAMREAEMADLKKSFDEVREAASGVARGNVMTSLQKDITNALRIDDADRPMDPQAASVSSAPLPLSDTPAGDTTVANTDPAVPTTAAAPLPETLAEAETQAVAAGPLATGHEIRPEPAPPAISDIPRDAKAS